MGIIFFLVVILIIVEIYIRVSKQNLNEIVNKYFNMKTIILLVAIIIIIPLLFIIGIKLNIINSYPKNVREMHDTEAVQREKGIILNNMEIKKNVYEQLNLSEDDSLSFEDIDSIIEIKDLETKSLSELSKFNNLQKLSIKWSSDKNLLPLQNLRKLKNLSFDYESNIDNIDPLKNLNELEYFSITSNRLTNISALENLKNLKEVHLNCDNLRDFSSIEKIINLEKLYINGVEIKDINDIN